MITRVLQLQGNPVMSRVLILEEADHKRNALHEEAHGPHYYFDSPILISWLEENLVDLLEAYLPVDLSPLRKITYPLATKQELIEDEAFEEGEIGTILAEGRRARKAAWQPPDQLISAITNLLECLGDDQHTFRSDLLGVLMEHSNGLVFNGEEAYFSNGQFAEDITNLKIMAERAKARGAKKVRIVIDHW